MKFINHIQAVDPRKATGTVAEIYAEAGRDFGRLPEPVMMWSPHEGLLAAGWAVLRETLLAGEVPRARKETIAASVSAGLRCPWCVDAHTTMLYATGNAGTAAAILADDDPVGENAPLVAWARGTAAPSGPPPPFGHPDATSPPEWSWSFSTKPSCPAGREPSHCCAAPPAARWPGPPAAPTRRDCPSNGFHRAPYPPISPGRPPTRRSPAPSRQ